MNVGAILALNDFELEKSLTSLEGAEQEKITGTNVCSHFEFDLFAANHQIQRFPFCCQCKALSCIKASFAGLMS